MGSTKCVKGRRELVPARAILWIVQALCVRARDVGSCRHPAFIDICTVNSSSSLTGGCWLEATGFLLPPAQLGELHGSIGAAQCCKRRPGAAQCGRRRLPSEACSHAFGNAILAYIQSQRSTAGCNALAFLTRGALAHFVICPRACLLGSTKCVEGRRELVPARAY